MELCKYCGRNHKPCTQDECYCGDGQGAQKGEGYNADCFYAFTGE